MWNDVSSLTASVPSFPTRSRARVHQNAPPNRALSARGPPFRLIIGLRAKSITPSIRGADLFGPMIGETDDLANFSAVADGRHGKKTAGWKIIDHLWTRWLECFFIKCITNRMRFFDIKACEFFDAINSGFAASINFTFDWCRLPVPFQLLIYDIAVSFYRFFSGMLLLQIFIDFYLFI